MNFIDIQNISKYFKTKDRKIQVLNNLSTKFYEGELTAIKGENGTGKTTLLKIVARHIIQDSGSIYWNTQNWDIFLKNNLSYLLLSSSRGFYYRLTLMQNLEFFLTIYKKKFLLSKAQEELESLSLWEHKDRRFLELSTGMAQKLSFVRAMLLEPKVILLDEFEHGIDQKSVEIIFNRVQKLKKDKVIIYISHQQELLNQSDNILELSNNSSNSNLSQIK
ncbi:ATP-binding cassette domain-containing protein [bacterium]|nr:ATP-binding cassette domain-containing protein [bacterium]